MTRKEAKQLIGIFVILIIGTGAGIATLLIHYVLSSLSTPYLTIIATPICLTGVVCVSITLYKALIK